MLDENTQAGGPQTENLPVEFSFKGLAVRTVSKDGEPWFVAADVCKALEIKNTTRANAPLDQDEKGLYLMKTLGGAQNLSVVNEFGLHRLILRSDKAKAKEFQRWVIHDVLPTIRKTGRYENNEQAAIDHAERRFQEIYSVDFVGPGDPLQILFGDKIPLSGHELFRFLARPTCEALGLRDLAAALDLLPKSEQGTVTIYTPQGPEELPAITEASMCRLAFTPRNRPDNAPRITKPFSSDDYINRFDLRLLAMLTTKAFLRWQQFRPRRLDLDGFDPFLHNFESALDAAFNLSAQYAEPDSDS
jgi:prophage antirepressor-like protein